MPEHRQHQAPGTSRHVNIPSPAPKPRATPPTPNSDFQRALQQAMNDGTVLQLNAPITLDAPVAVTIPQSHQGWFGLDGNLNKIYSRVRGAPAIRFYMDSSVPQGTCARGMFVGNFGMVGGGSEEGGLQLDIPFNDRWLVNLELRSIWIEGMGGKAGLTVAGSIFESFGYNVGTMNCKGAGLYFANAGEANNKGIVSAFRLFGGTQRQNDGDGYLVDQYDGPGDVRLYGLYFCENGKSGISTIAGIELVDGCGFENNHGGQGIYVENYAYLRKCTGSTYGPQPFLVKGYIVNPWVMDECSVAGYGGGNPKLTNLSGNGTCTMIACRGEVESSPGVEIVEVG